MLHLGELVFAQKALRGGEPCVCEHPALCEAKVYGRHVDVFQQHFLVVAAQGDDLVGKFFLEAHDAAVDVEACGPAVAVVAQQDEPRCSVVQVDMREGLFEGFDETVDIAHGVDGHGAPVARRFAPSIVVHACLAGWADFAGWGAALRRRLRLSEGGFGLLAARLRTLYMAIA